jgi:murein DD-endopeptidase MepM/ murein hydrolase activator NlpD
VAYAVTGEFAMAMQSAAFAAATVHASQHIGTLKLARPLAAVAHGMVGGTMSALRGGRFGAGFAGSFVNKMMSGNYGNNRYIGTAMGALVGGTVSRIGGGKFANGAITGAIQTYYNEYGAEEGSQLSTVEDFDWEYYGPAWPTDHVAIQSGYDLNRRHPVTGKLNPHRAIDITNPKGDPVYSISDGTVAEVYQGGKGDAGNYLKVDHANGLQSSYAHTGSTLVKGGSVLRGQTIGHSDGSGVGTGPHLHFSLRRNGGRIKPCSVLSCP